MLPADAMLQAFTSGWQDAPAGLLLRHETDADVDFLRMLYGSARADELAVVDWPQAARDRFVAQQFDAQRRHYRQHYPGAAFLVIEHAGERIGRLYLHRTRSELRLMEVTLLPARRGRGLGSSLMHRMIAVGDALQLPTSLHVEPFNPAQRLYLKLGFRTREVRGVHHFMWREPGQPV